MNKGLIKCFFLSISISVFSYGATEVDCDKFSGYGISSECNQCFDGGYIYLGKGKVISDTWYNNREYDEVYFKNENKTPVEVNNLKINDTTWFITNKLVKYPDNFKWKKSKKSHKIFHWFKKNTNEKYLIPIPGSGIRLTGIGNKAKRDIPAVKVKVITNYHIYKNNQLGMKQTYTSCLFYKPAWCGDGVVDKKYGEKCDPKDPKKQNWSKKGCNIKTCKPIK